MVFHYGDIPDNFTTKPFFPLGRHLWRGLRELGWEYWQKGINGLAKEEGGVYDFLKSRLDSSIITAKEVIDGKILPEDAKRMLSYNLFPPVITLRADLCQGFMRLMMGDSVDTTFVILDDEKNEIFFMLNSHEEDGIPVDFWVVTPQDRDLLERRHMKLGYKLIDFPKRFKDKNKMAHAILDVLRDVRNERTPQWSDSFYVIAVAWMSSCVNSIYIVSNYEAMVSLWDYFNPKEYGLPFEWVGYYPTPPTLTTFMYMKRPEFGLRFASMMFGNYLYCQGVEDNIYDWSMEEIPELFNIIFQYQWENPEVGIQMPMECIHYYPPILKKKETYERELFDFRINKKVVKKKHPVITLESFNMDFDEARTGVFTDISHQTEPNETIDESRVVSIGLGKDTRFLRELEI
ncbi:MAG: hypothetical protein HWN67_05320 [Candidatus Helarchaeota archaeon]|nr:hypothetical protein [Candidatus Helarchaeota archaeon]